MKSDFSAIVAMNRNNVIAINGKIPWYHKKDLKNFRQLTTGKIVVMGNNTFISLKKPLKDRYNIVITSGIPAHTDNTAFGNLSFIKKIREIYHGEIFIIGGESIYRQLSDHINKLYITIIDDNTDSSSALYFPWEFFKGSWRVTNQENWENAVYLILEK